MIFSVRPRRTAGALMLAGAILAALPAADAASAAIDTRAIGEALRQRLEAAGLPASLTAFGRAIHAGEALPTFYERRGYAPAWIGRGGPIEGARALVDRLLATGDDGLDPRDYHADELRGLLARVEDGGETHPAWLADLDLRLTDAFLIYGAHLVSGRLDPESFDPEWIAVRREVDLVATLQGCLERGGDVAATLATLEPRDPGYAALRATLARYRRIAAAGGWPALPDGPTLREGDADPRVTLLRRRLATTGDLAGAGNAAVAAGDDDAGAAASRYDAALAAAVERFQRRHGLEVDGAVGQRTREALNVPVADRIAQLGINLERWRWLPVDLGERHIIVNIPAYRLDLFEDGLHVLDLRVVVGKSYRRTPVFSDTMRYLVINPYWEVPPSIAVHDKLPLLRKDPAALVAAGFHVFRGFGADAESVDPLRVDWNAVTPRQFPYRLRQDPGPNNALGQIKFMFPNRFNVYLHDTPSRELFAHAERSFSSGCIRVEDPVRLATAVLAGTAGWDAAALRAALDTGQTRTVSLGRPVRVHLLYWTAWVDDDGTVEFRRDLYGRDERVLRALAAPAPDAGPTRDTLPAEERPT